MSQRPELNRGGRVPVFQLLEVHLEERELVHGSLEGEKTFSRTFRSSARGFSTEKKNLVSFAS